VRRALIAFSDVDFFILEHSCTTVDEMITIIERAMREFPFEVIFWEMVNQVDLPELLEDLTYAPDLRQIVLSP
jgi:hypothetical protein